MHYQFTTKIPWFLLKFDNKFSNHQPILREPEVIINYNLLLQRQINKANNK